MHQLHTALGGGYNEKYFSSPIAPRAPACWMPQISRAEGPAGSQVCCQQVT